MFVATLHVHVDEKPRQSGLHSVKIGEGEYQLPRHELEAAGAEFPAEPRTVAVTVPADLVKKLLLANDEQPGNPADCTSSETDYACVALLAEAVRG